MILPYHRTSRGGGAQGRLGSSIESNSLEQPRNIARQETEDYDETQPASPETNEDSSLVGSGGQVPDSASSTQLHPETLWFSHQKVTKEISEAIKGHYPHPYLNWTETPDHQREQWFNVFKKKYTWTPDLQDRVVKAFKRKAGRRLKGLISKVGKQRTHPKWMSPTVFYRLKEKRANPDFIERSENALANRMKGSEDGKVVPGHRNGSISTFELVERMTKENNGVRPGPVQIFERSHTFTAPTGEKVFVSQKAQSTMEAYERIALEDEEQGVVRPESDVFYHAVGGTRKGQVYGLGQSAPLYYNIASSSGYNSTATSQHITEIHELKELIASQDNKMEAQARELEMLRSEVGENRDLKEQVLEMKNQMDMFSQLMQQNCTSGSPFQP